MKEGDPNDKYFHECINKRRKENVICSIEANGRRLNEASEIKNKIFGHFKNQFLCRGVTPIPANIEFKTMETWGNEELVREFVEEEARKAV